MKRQLPKEGDTVEISVSSPWYVFEGQVERGLKTKATVEWCGASWFRCSYGNTYAVRSQNDTDWRIIEDDTS